jgi:hypothetical protein
VPGGCRAGQVLDPFDVELLEFGRTLVAPTQEEATNYLFNPVVALQQDSATQAIDAAKDAAGGAPAHHHLGYAPIGVMGGGHAHAKGEWMVSYRYMKMSMDGVRSGDSRIGNSEVLTSGTGTFMVTPTDMDMEMHMLGFMNAVSDETTVMVMLPYIRSTMNHVMASGGRFKTRAESLGDLKVSGVHVLDQGVHHQWLVNMGLSAPTGAIDEIDFTPAGTVRLPYPMQPGSGTWDLFPGVTYLEHIRGPWSGGFQASGVIRLGRNGYDYSLGNELGVTHRIARQLDETNSVSLRFNHRAWDNIDGADSAQTGAPTVPTKRTDMRGGFRSDLLIGWSSEQASGHRVAVEFGVPIYQKLEGIQLETDWTLGMGWQYAW